jgi:uncharacterized protein YprB with RNaseH-like and TPR domain
MALDLRSRLALIREKSRGGEKVFSPLPETSSTPAASLWENAAAGVLRRTFILRPGPVPAIPPALPVVLPDLEVSESPLSSGRFLFFDLETTGLSGGAGTVAFLAAFGRFTKGLEITQFLLLDYPAEADFIDAILRFMNDSPDGTFLATYNGKTFDSQILKTRCLMNGFSPPSFSQLDLLYPSRRMWKRVLPNCSQATIETMILGLDRSGDPGGFLAPGIWFDFLRSGENFGKPGPASVRLESICDHNVKDIGGLASIFTVFTEIAASPLEAANRYRCDLERLALVWRRSTHEARGFDAECETTASKLLEAAAREYPRSCLRLAFDFSRAGRREEGRALLARIPGPDGAAWRISPDPAVRALALRALAIDAEKTIGPEPARSFLEQALQTNADALPKGLRGDLERRLKRFGFR